MGSNVPIFVVCRDKVTPLRQLINWLEVAGCSNIFLVDNASTYPPLLDWYESCGHAVVRLAENMGPFEAIWGGDLLQRYAKGLRYIVTDSDVVPDALCPLDAIDVFGWCLDRYPVYAKAGFGLRIDDLPADLPATPRVLAWERQFWARRIDHGLFHAKIDTTFALYRSGQMFTRHPAIRTGPPYVAAHTPWYVHPGRRTAEEQYYVDNCRWDLSNWDVGRFDIAANQLTIREQLLWRAHSRFRIARDETAGPFPGLVGPGWGR